MVALTHGGHMAQGTNERRRDPALPECVRVAFPSTRDTKRGIIRTGPPPATRTDLVRLGKR